jgi:hypothetical protein
MGGKASQLWYFDFEGGEHYVLRNLSSELCVDTQGVPDQVLVQSDCVLHRVQRWQE